MSDLYNGIHEYNSNDIGGLILPTSFEDALSYDQQILWLYLYKQALLQAGDNIELHENTDGTVTISSTSSGATYTIRSTTPDSGFGSAYELVNVDTGERAGAKINIPEAIDGVGITSIVFKETDPQGNNVYTVNLTDGSHYDIVCPRGLQGVAGQDGRDGQDGQDGTNGTDGVGITSITFKETDAQGNNIYTVNLSNSTSYDITCPKGAKGDTGDTGEGVTAGGTTGQVLSKVDGTDYNTQWRDVHEVPSGGTSGQVLSKVDGTDYNAQWATPSGLPAGGSANNVIVKNSGTAGDASWKTFYNAARVASVAFYNSNAKALTASQYYTCYIYTTPYNSPETLEPGSAISGLIASAYFVPPDWNTNSRLKVIRELLNLAYVEKSGLDSISTQPVMGRIRFSITQTFTAGAIRLYGDSVFATSSEVGTWAFNTYMRRSSDPTFSEPCTVIMRNLTSLRTCCFFDIIFGRNVELNYVADESFHIMLYGLL